MLDRVVIAITSFAFATAPVFAGPIEDSQALFDRMVELTPLVIDAVDAPVSKQLARSLETNVLDPLGDASRAWEDAASASDHHNSYAEFNLVTWPR